MKTAISIFLIGIFPVLALAAGENTGGRAAGQMRSGAGHDSGQMGGAGMAGAAGRPGDPAKVDRTIGVVMEDSMRFTPNTIEVKKGETIRFFIKNGGKVPHEMAIGRMDELKAHAAQMKSMPAMQHVAPNMITLNPGQRGGIVWQFDKPGIVDFVCLVTGHLEAGMVGKVSVM